MKKTNVYIDGYNLYYGLLKGTSYKWLDLEKFARALLGDEHQILSISYFTSPVKTYPHDLEAVDRRHARQLHPPPCRVEVAPRLRTVFASAPTAARVHNS